MQWLLMVSTAMDNSQQSLKFEPYASLQLNQSEYHRDSKSLVLKKKRSNHVSESITAIPTLFHYSLRTHSHPSYLNEIFNTCSYTFYTTIV